ncbi:MAG: glycoside hydrolase family 92 protein [Prevotella ruminicola]|uniref:Glycoside hydrolase family 92 protein n=1 Tax=Xylanibacter ruminicola TaxID=839 RepID=A0A928GHG9_XYLRU|nr:glycoside hydrolase family 92 protein [Xylanibacter ruminicola]
MKLKTIVTTVCLLLCSMVSLAQVWQYVDPRIGSEGVGRTFPGPSMPFGMCKPGPDCTVKPNAGWAKMPEVVTGFSQTHVSGTGGGQKYGNILIQPGCTEQKRVNEEFSLGYYATTFESGIRTEITTSDRCAFYRIHYPKSGSLLIDATHYLGKNPVPDLREQQQFIGGEVEMVNNHEIRGYSRIRGGWNNGDAYTVFFCLISDKPFKKKNENTVEFADTLLNIKVGISYVSEQQAKRNIPACDFDTQLSKLRTSWEALLSRIQIKGTEADKRMFYTALYHTMIMPVDKTGENPKWTEHPYYDDYYAIWDTYRSSSPLITLIDPKREAEIVNSLLNIYKREGYMPDARSGDCNGRTQGGSNAEVVIADAFAKGVEGIDYDFALEAMLKDAEVDPGADHEKHGRGGLHEYLKYGYLPYGIDRAGTRTIEYAYNDYCIALVAKGLGRMDIYERYLKQSQNWKNLWRADYEWDDVKGYIMPKDADGRWLDSVPWGKSKVYHPLIPYTPITKVAPWYLPWWSTFFYEALSAEYSLSIPHDVPGLIEACGGAETFRKRLDMFFDRKRYNVGNEPSFLTPCLYHWIGRPDLTSDRVRKIISENYNDKPDGLPGNDDSGAMSSWLAFHMMGLYPNAGQSYYLMHAPLIPEWTMQLANGKSLHGVVKGQGTHFEKVTLNGRLLNDARLEHADLMKGGELVFYVSNKSIKEGNNLFPTEKQTVSAKETTRFSVGNYSKATPSLKAAISFTLNKQFRTWPLSYAWQGDTMIVTCKEATYRIPRAIVENGNMFCWEMPSADGAIYDAKGTFAFISCKAFRELEQNGVTIYDGITWRLVDRSDVTLHVMADIDRTEMWIKCDDYLPLVLEMRHNPLGIDWTIDE